MHHLKDTVKSNQDQFGDEELYQDIVSKLEKATSLGEHLAMFANFYRRQHMLDDNTR